MNYINIGYCILAWVLYCVGLVWIMIPIEFIIFFAAYVRAYLTEYLYILLALKQLRRN